MGGGVQKYARRLTAVYYAEARTETRPGKFGLIWLCTSSVSFALPSTDSKTTTRTATSPVSYHSPILTRAILVGWNEGTFEGCLNEGEEQNVVDARHDRWMCITDIGSLAGTLYYPARNNRALSCPCSTKSIVRRMRQLPHPMKPRRLLHRRSLTLRTACPTSRWSCVPCRSPPHARWTCVGEKRQSLCLSPSHS